MGPHSTWKRNYEVVLSEVAQAVGAEGLEPPTC
jgi:hypothetical protein